LEKPSLRREDCVKKDIEEVNPSGWRWLRIEIGGGQFFVQDILKGRKTLQRKIKLV
jgi:hypothetical protein